jgi:hypothetical protein
LTEPLSGQVSLVSIEIFATPLSTLFSITARKAGQPETLDLRFNRRNMESDL